MNEDATKLPWFKMFCGDWLKDPQLSFCTPATRGVWMDLICAMHELGRAGELRGTADQLARIARCQPAELVQALTDLQTTGAADVEERNGAYRVCNRRMAREVRISQIRAEAGKKGGAASLLKQNGKQTHQQTDQQTPQQPSVSDSVSESPTVKGVKGETTPPGFVAFWAAWPSGGRKVARKQCLAAWRSHGCEAIADRVLAALAWFKKQPDWIRDGGKYIPMPQVWLNQDRWEAAPQSKPPTATAPKTPAIDPAELVRRDNERRQRDAAAIPLVDMSKAGEHKVQVPLRADSRKDAGATPVAALVAGVVNG